MLFGTWLQLHAYDPSNYMETGLCRVFKVPLELLAFAITLKGINTLKRVIKGRKKIKISSYKSRGKSYPDIRLIRIMLTDSLLSINGVSND